MDRLRSFDRWFSEFLRKWSIPALRISLAIVFIWFGALKVFGVTPVADLVASTVYWFDPDWVVPALGVVEIVVGLGLLFQVAMRAVLGLFFLQMIGTFLVRSGVLTSVHTFAQDPTRGLFILGLLIIAIGGSLTLYALRAPAMKAGGLFAPISREGSLVLNNLLLMTAAATARHA